jgi:hypothetical protein
VVEILVLGVLALTAVFFFTVLTSVLGMVLWAIFLPFKILGWMLKGAALLLAIPFIAVFGLVAFLVLGAGMLVFFVPFLPFVLIALGAWWLVGRKRGSTASGSTASVVS